MKTLIQMAARAVSMLAVATVLMFTLGYLVSSVAYAVATMSLSVFNILEWETFSRVALVFFSLAFGIICMLVRILKGFEEYAELNW